MFMSLLFSSGDIWTIVTKAKVVARLNLAIDDNNVTTFCY